MAWMVSSLVLFVVIAGVAGEDAGGAMMGLVVLVFLGFVVGLLAPAAFLQSRINRLVHGG